MRAILPLTQTLDEGRKKFLNELGDSINKAFYPFAPLDTGQGTGNILYRKIDTTYKAANGLITHDSVFIVSADHSYPLYNLSFSNVGQGKGNYILNSQGLNGNVLYVDCPGKRRLSRDSLKQRNSW